MSRGRGANVTVTIGAAFSASFRDAFRQADAELKRFEKSANKTMRSMEKRADAARKHVAGIGAGAKDATAHIITTGKELRKLGAATTVGAARAARDVAAVAAAGKTATKRIRTTNAELGKTARVATRAARALSAANDGGVAIRMPKTITAKSLQAERAARTAARKATANGNVPAGSALPPRGAAKATRDTARKTTSRVKPVAANDASATTVAMPKNFAKVVRDTTKATQKLGRAAKGVVSISQVANGNGPVSFAGMPPGFSKALKAGVANGVITGNKAVPPVAANPVYGNRSGTPRTGSGVPALPYRAPPPAGPWGNPAAPAPRGGHRGSGAVPPAPPTGPALLGGLPPAGPGGGQGGRRRGGRGGGPRRAHSGSHGAVGSHDAGALMAPVVGAMSAEGVWDIVKEGGKINDLQVLMKLQGRNSQEIAQATAQAYKIAKENPAISAGDALRSIIDVADTGDRDLKKAGRLAPYFARSAKALEYLSDTEMKGKLGEGQGRALGRAVEDLGYGTKSEGEIKELVDAVTAGTIATRGIFNPKELFQTIQKSGGMARGWNKEFIGQVLPAFTMAMGGSGSGDALYMFQKLMTKGQGQLSSAKALMDLGLINKNDLLYDGNKFLGIKPHAMPDDETLNANPYEWFQKNVVPAALKKAGITDIKKEREGFNALHANDDDVKGLGSAEERNAKLSDKFKTYLDNQLQASTDTFAKAKNTSKMIADMIAQSEQIEGQIALMKKQPKNALDIMFGENFQAQVEGVSKSFHTLMGALGSAETSTAISVMDALGKGMSALGAMASANPEGAKQVMAAFAAIAAGLAVAGGIAIGGMGVAAIAAAPWAVAIGAVGAGLAAWAALDWDGFSSGAESLMTGIGHVKSAIDWMNSMLGDNGETPLGKLATKLLGNDPAKKSPEAQAAAAKELESVTKRLDNAGDPDVPSTPGRLPMMRHERENLERRRDALQAELRDTMTREVAPKSDPQTVMAPTDFGKKPESKTAKMTDRAAAEAAFKERQATMQAAIDQAYRKHNPTVSQPEDIDAARKQYEHATHGDEAMQKRLEGFKKKPQVKEPEGKKKRNKEAPISAENVVDVGEGKPLTDDQWKEVQRKRRGSRLPVENAPPVTAVPPATSPVKPVAPAAMEGGDKKMTVDIPGPVAIKEPIGIKQPLQLVTPVLITAAGLLNVHDAQLQATMSGLSGQLSAINGTLGGILAACQAIAAKDFSPKITVNGSTGSTSSAGASAGRERSSFSD